MKPLKMDKNYKPPTVERPLNFESANQRNEWIIKNADYFTACRLINRQRIRMEAKTLEGARWHAQAILSYDNSKPVLIYAVKGLSDTYIEMVKP